MTSTMDVDNDWNTPWTNSNRDDCSSLIEDVVVVSVVVVSVAEPSQTSRRLPTKSTNTERVRPIMTTTMTTTTDSSFLPFFVTTDKRSWRVEVGKNGWSSVSVVFRLMMVRSSFFLYFYYSIYSREAWKCLLLENSCYTYSYYFYESHTAGSFPSIIATSLYAPDYSE